MLGSFFYFRILSSLFLLIKHIYVHIFSIFVLLRLSKGVMGFSTSKGVMGFLRAF